MYIMKSTLLATKALGRGSPGVFKGKESQIDNIVNRKSHQLSKRNKECKDGCLHVFDVPSSQETTTKKLSFDTFRNTFIESKFIAERRTYS